MRTRGRVAMSVALVLVVAAAGTVGLVLSARASRTSQAMHRRDRQQLQQVLGTLTTEYLLLAYEDELGSAAGKWSLQPGDAGDLARLTAFTSRSPLLTYGAALVGPAGQVLVSSAPHGPLPPRSDPGYRPLIAALAAGSPAVSAGMRDGPATVVAMAVPVAAGAARPAVLYGYFRADTSALQAYAASLRFGASGRNFVVDSTGHVIAGTERADVGSPLRAGPALAELGRGQTGFVQYRQGGQQLVASYAPVGVGGWGTVTVENAGEFFGPLRAGHTRVETALVAVLALASMAIALLAFKRERAQHRYHDQLAYQAAHDPLTGLPNRALFSESLAAAVSRARRESGDLALLYIDLDEFKRVNDTHGHDTGDVLLSEIAGRLHGCVRQGDLVARIGGDEFTVVMESIGGLDEAAAVAERIVQELSEPFVISGVPLRVGASVGVACSRLGEDDGEGLLREADAAMYQAKDDGRARYRLYAPTGWPQIPRSSDLVR